MANKKSLDSVTVTINKYQANHLGLVSKELLSSFKDVVGDLRNEHAFLLAEDSIVWLLKKCLQYSYKDKIKLRLTSSKALVFRNAIQMSDIPDYEQRTLIENVDQFLIGYKDRLKSK